MDHRCEGKIWLTNVKYLWLLPNTSWTLVSCIDIHVCTVSKVISIKRNKVIYLPNKE